jgi:diguanylate cyclase (GGDEF)-like protein
LRFKGDEARFIVKSLARGIFDRFLKLGAPKDASEEMRGKLRAAQLATVLTYTPWMIGANVVNALAVFIAFYGHDYAVRAAIWACCVIGMSAFVISKWLKGRSRPAPRSVRLGAIRRAVINALLLGGIWGLLAPLLYPVADANAKLVVICVLAGMLCGSGFVLSTVPAAAITFAGSIAFGVVFALLLTPSLASLLIFWMSVIYIGIIAAASLSLSRLLSGRMMAEAESREQRDVISLLLNDFTENASDWLWAVDANLKVTQMSARFSHITGRPVESYIGADIAECIPVLPASRCTSEEIEAITSFRRLMQEQGAFKDATVPVEMMDKKRVWSFSAKPVLREDGTFLGYRGVGRDITEELEAKANIEHLAKYDALTGLPNRVLFKEEIDKAFSRLKRHGEHFAILLLDLDHFKKINDTQGHGEGDALLVQVGDRLRGLLRDFDTVARLGGDEFAIILAAIEQPQEAANLAERISTELCRPFKLSNAEAVIGVSIGIDLTAAGSADGDTLMRHADLALYRSKNEGRGVYHFFEEAMDAAARHRHRLENDLRTGLLNNELELYFQPLVDAHSRAVNAFEALVRWNHPEFGMLNPAEFISLAEEVGLIQPLGAWVIRRACMTAMAWPPHIRVAVNLSPAQFRSLSLFTQVQEALAESGLAPNRLELEVTESLLMDSSAQVLSILTALRQLGVRISLDDFGTGYSSLSYLRKFRFDKIKIDRSFVKDIETEPECQAIIDTLIRLAGDLNMALVVEGVETEGQLALLKARGCTEVQGFLIARPAPAAALEPFLTMGQSRTRRRRAA